MTVRETLNSKPWIGWCVALVAVALAALFYFRGTTDNAPDSVDTLSQSVTIRCTETGNEWEMNRGQLMEMLLLQPGPIDPSRGIPSQFADGRPTGVIVDKDAWSETVEYVNTLKEAVAKRGRGGG